MHKVMRGHTDPRVEAVSVVVWDTLLFIFTYGVVRLRHKNHLDRVRKTICCRLRCFTNIQWFHAYKWWNAAGKCPHLEKLKCCLSLSIHLISISSKDLILLPQIRLPSSFIPEKYRNQWSLTFVDTLSLIYQGPQKKTVIVSTNIIRKCLDGFMLVNVETPSHTVASCCVSIMCLNKNILWDVLQKCWWFQACKC